MELNRIMEERRSIRSFAEGKTVSREAVEEILQAAAQAPTWKNSQTARSYVILSPEKMQQVREACLPESNQRNSRNAAALIVTTFVKGQSGFDNQGNPANELGDQWGAYDLGLHNAYLILKARDLGLDTLIMGIRDGEKEGMQALTQTFSFESALSMKEKGFSLHEDVRQKSPEGSGEDKVLRTFGKLVTEDIRVISGKVMLRGSAQGEALLLRQSTGAMEKERFSIPYSQIVELEGAEEGDAAQVEYSVKNCACTVSSDEEGPFLSWDIAADVMVSIHRPVQYEVLMDAFSTKGSCTLQQEPLDLPLARCGREASAEMRVTLSPPEQADALLDWSASVKSCGAIGKEGVAHGEVCVNLLCMTRDGQPMQYDQMVSWEGHFPPMEGEDCLCQCDISGLSLKWADGTCQLTGPVAFHLTGQSGKPVRQVVDCQMEENAPAPARPKASLILRRAEGGETVWLLAKSFRTSPGDIMAANHLETGGALEKGQLVMIPFQR